MKKILACLLGLSGLFCASAILANDAPAKTKSSDTTASAKPVKYVSHGSVVVDGNRIRYTATAGTIILHDDNGKPTASMFYIAYTKDDANPSRRPVTFAYNGGPGGSSVMVNIGGFGPKRVPTTDAAPTPPPPYKLEDNKYSLLDKSDLVFIDAVGTGESKLLGKGGDAADTGQSKKAGAAKGNGFWSVDGDVDSFGQFIQNYITENNRWNSPKFVLGESYGTPRSAMLANWLQEKGIALNGVVLLSSILNFNDEFWFQPPGSNDLAYELYLPSYAAVAWYHDKLPNKPQDLPAFLKTVRAFALGQYDQALKQGDDISASARDAVLAKLHAYTGLSERYLKEADLRVAPQRFMKELMRDDRRTVGRYDGRYEGIDPDAAGEEPDSDPSGTAIFPALATAFHAYLNNTLKYPGGAQYQFLSYKVNKSWDWHHKIDGREYPVPDTIPDLRAAMSQEPHLKVFSGNGYFDLATPFFKTEYELNHMGLDPSLRKNITFAYYHDGHMIYIHDAAMKKIHEDLDKFYDSAVGS